MITLLVLYAVLVGGLTAASAMCIDGICALRRWPRRLIWAVALVTVLALPATVVWRAAEAGSAAESAGVSTAVRMLTPTWLPGPPDMTTPELAAVLTRTADPVVLALWLIMSTVTLAVYAVGHATLARRRRTWRPIDLDGTRVLVADDAGPAVVGLLAPRIVMPAWVMALDARACALILEHERQHVAARDAWLVHLTCVATVLCPWNPAIWWIGHRLRLAIELDCDARVLRQRAADADTAAFYSHVLVDVASRRPTGALTIAPALIEPASRLALRIAAIFPGEVRHAKARSAASGLVAAALVAAACQAPVPTPPAETSTTTSTGSVSEGVRPADPTIVDPDTPSLTPPVVLRERRPDYTPAAMQAKLEGKVTLEAVVDVNGRATAVRVRDSLDDELDQAAVRALREWRFAPATLDGTPVATEVTVEMEFSLH